MQEFSSPDLVDVPQSTSISDILTDRVSVNPAATLFERRAGDSWAPVSSGDFASEVNAVAKGFIARGIDAGDRVAILSRTRYEWTVLDFALWAAGAVPVPVYESSSAEQVHWVLSDTGCRLAVVESPQNAATVAEVRSDLPELEDVLVIDDGAVGQLAALGVDIPDAELDARRAAVTGADLATIIYTSGSTGRPKGAELTHRNFVVLSRNAAALLRPVVGDGSRTLMFLPLAHVLARLLEVVSIDGGAILAHTADPRHLVEDLGSYHPTFVLAVPRIFEKVYNTAQQTAGTGIKRRVFTWATRVSIAYSRALDADGPSSGLRAQHALADRLVYTKLRSRLGGQLKFSICGGAPLGERLGHFYRGIGLTIIEGYGLTETTAPTAVGLPDANKIGTVGIALPGTALRVDDDAELWVKGEHVFRGYHNQPELTDEVVIDGWFRTGDLASIDDEGYVRITGRKKEIIVTAGGKNVAPSLLEDRLRSYTLVSQVVVVGDQRPFIGALVTLDTDMLPGWLATHGLAPMGVEEAAKDPTVLAAIDAAVERANRAVSRAESIRKITVLTTDFTEANGYLTPSLKVKRALVIKDFAPVIDQLYGGPVSDEG